MLGTPLFRSRDNFLHSDRTNSPLWDDEICDLLFQYTMNSYFDFKQTFFTLFLFQSVFLFWYFNLLPILVLAVIIRPPAGGQNSDVFFATTVYVFEQFLLYFENMYVGSVCVCVRNRSLLYLLCKQIYRAVSMCLLVSVPGTVVVCFFLCSCLNLVSLHYFFGKIPTQKYIELIMDVL